MTPKQKRVYYFIRSTINSSGICPTYDEIMGALNIKSKSVVANYLNHLEKEGKIKINRVKARGIEIEDEETSKLKKKIERLEKQLKIALAAFRMIRYSHNTIKDRKTGEVYYTWHYAEMKIKELEK